MAKHKSGELRCPATALIGIEVKQTNCTFQFNKYFSETACTLRGRVDNADAFLKSVSIKLSR